MKLYCCYTESHSRLFNDYFLPSIPPDLELVAHKLDMQGEDHFLSPRFLECITTKVRLIIDSLKASPGEGLIWSDVDILFFQFSSRQALALLEENGADILFQRSCFHNKDANTGFFICRANPQTIAFFQSVEEQMRREPHRNEESIVNEKLHSCPLKWTYLPNSFYVRSQGWPPPHDLTLYHAASTLTQGPNGLQKKIRLFTEIQRIKKYGWPALILSCIWQARHRVVRWLGIR